MRISFIVEPFFAANRIFALDDPVANRDGCQEPFARLREVLSEKGIKLDTQDICPVDQADSALFFNAPSQKCIYFNQALDRKIPIHVLALESEYIHLPNGDLDFLNKCQTVFTYNDDLADGNRYILVRYPQRLRPPALTPWDQKKFACMLSGNKWSSHPSQLYQARLKIIEWYELHAPARFDLYGPQWNLPVPRNLLFKIVRRIPGLRKLFDPRISVWRGMASSKEEVISQYRFCFCYENFANPSGWVTEKIFDAMFGGAVPVYWGPKNSSNLIPKECFIDASEFNSVGEVDSVLSAMSEAEYMRRIEMARSFLNSNAAQVFSIDHFVSVIVDRLGIRSNKNEE